MKIACFGDMGLFGKNALENNPNVIERFEIIKEFLQTNKYDIVLANLETPMTNAKKTIGGKSAYLKCSPGNIKILEDIGITHVTVANNHMFDYGKEGFKDTLDELERSKIEYFGTREKPNLQVQNVMFRGYCCFSTNARGLREENKEYINVLNYNKAINDLDEDKKNGLISLMSIHWGQEHVNIPNYNDIILVNDFLKHNKLIVHGHHPHVLQPIIEKGDSVIAYSLGNMFFDDVYTKKSDKPLVKMTENNNTTCLLEININNENDITYKTYGIKDDGTKLIFVDKVFNEEWEELLKLSKDDYISKRERIIQERLSIRKNQRNLSWYIKRLNLESIKMMYQAKKNKKEYNKNIKVFLERQ